MAHDIDFSIGKPSIAYVGQKPWHGLGHELPSDASIKTWIQAAGLEWQILCEPVRYVFHDELREMPNRHVLIRSDNGAPLSVVSDSYCIVQPKEVIEFYRELVNGSAFSLETAGALDGGRKVWGLARTKSENNFNPDDRIEPYLLLASSCDKSLATTVSFTSIRVVCQNTLGFAMEDIKGKPATKCFKITHDKPFKWDEAKLKLSLVNTAWESFVKKIERLSLKKVNQSEVDEFFKSLFLSGKKDDEKLTSKAILEIQNLKSAYVNGTGQQLPTAKDTAWGLVNAVTYYVDHKKKSKNQSERLDSAWFGTGSIFKDRAWDTAMNMFHDAV